MSCRKIDGEKCEKVIDSQFDKRGFRKPRRHSMERDLAHWLIEDSDYYEPPNYSTGDAFDDEDVLEPFNDNISYEDMIP